MSQQRDLRKRNGRAIIIFILVTIAVIGFVWQQRILSIIERQNEEIIAQLEQQIAFLKSELIKPGKELR
ncbi:MAG: hypothetical protein NTV81_01795 [Candidatus Komeilibacteria bacterium]|nr:hypothetical protein [Candidatus Komeilibacteria bacterium]